MDRKLLHQSGHGSGQKLPFQSFAGFFQLLPAPCLAPFRLQQSMQHILTKLSFRVMARFLQSFQGQPSLFHPPFLTLQFTMNFDSFLFGLIIDQP
ncbi:MAG: hypothetical protein HQL76_14465 [Magnetococcales bacterium]|nr:hypothetical protein [Magnetococcales bacterium]